ncbi:hypothetical protein [Pseudorhodobacter aquimaris]|nr:hypothetical protein [Pseudorhodobacter aquimaris]
MLRIPFAHRVDAVFVPVCLRRIGIIANGREFSAVIAVLALAFTSLHTRI